MKCTYSTEGEMVYGMMGGIIGDIVGSSREGYGSNQASVRKLFTTQSNFTDDTALMVAIAEWLTAPAVTDVKETLLKWGNRYPNAGYGTLTKVFLATGQPQHSEGNGAAMRVAPCGLAASSLELAIMLGERQCEVTHTTPTAIIGARAIAAATYLAQQGRLEGKSPEQVKAQIKAEIESRCGYNLSLSLEQIHARSMELARMREQEKVTGVANPAYIRTSNAGLSCPMAIIAFLLGQSYEEALRYALAMGGDSDTIACMAGSISAQLYGIPKQMVEQALISLPHDVIEAINRFEPHNSFTPSRIAPPKVNRWSPTDDFVVYGCGQTEAESGYYEVFQTRFRHRVAKGYAIPTIGQSLEDIAYSIAELIAHAKAHPERRFHIRKVGYDKAGYTLEQIAPLFAAAKELDNILLPQEMIEHLGW